MHTWQSLLHSVGLTTIQASKIFLETLIIVSYYEYYERNRTDHNPNFSSFQHVKLFICSFFGKYQSCYKCCMYYLYISLLILSNVIFCIKNRWLLNNFLDILRNNSYLPTHKSINHAINAVCTI